MSRLLNILLSLVALAAFASDPAKSDYYFMEALRQDALENQDASTALMRRAYELNPDPGSVPAKLVAFSEISLAGSDSIRFNQGIKMAQKYVDANPDDYYIGVSLADVYGRCGRPDLAKPLYARAYASHPEIGSLGLRYAQTLAGSDEPDSALTVLRAVERIHGVNMMTAYPICYILMMEKADTVAALEEVDRLLAAMPTDGDAVALATATYERANQPERALTVLDSCIEADPAELPLHTYRIYMSARQEKVPETRSALLNSLACDELGQTEVDQLLAYFAAEVCGNDSTWFLLTLEAADAAEKRFPESALPNLLRVHVNECQDNDEAAMVQLRKAIDKVPTRADLWARLMLLQLRRDENDAAIATGRKALKACEGEDDADIRMVLASAYAGMKNYREAAAAIRPIANDESLEPQERAHYLCTLADCLQYFESTDSAAAVYEKVIELDPNYIMAKNNYAYMISEQGGDMALAERLIGEVMAEEPHNPTYLDTAAWVAYKQGKYALANVFIDEALALDNTDSEELAAHAAAIKAELEK